MGGFPTDTARRMPEDIRLAVDNNMSGWPRIAWAILRHEKVYDVTIGTTLKKHRISAPQLEATTGTVRGCHQNR
ncbi:MAG: hypothetical protein JWR14_5995 [Caballeronia sp.]|jgi:hypothetical protein|nr:hypothetical protein [Caballeronia sp.]